VSAADEPKRRTEPPTLPMHAARDRGTAPAPSFLPPDAGDNGDAFLERLAPSARPAPAGSSPPQNRADVPGTEPRPAPSRSDVREVQPGAMAADPATKTGVSGLMSGILAREARNDVTDDGARAALRTLPYRLRRGADVGRNEASSPRARAELLQHLADKTDGERRSQLLVSASELLSQIARAVPAPADAAALNERASALRAAAESGSDAVDLTALRRRQARALRARELHRARELYAAETELPVSGAERALAACALAEIDAARGADAATVLASLATATAADPGSLVPNLLRARLELQLGKRRDAAASLRRAAEARADAPLRGLLFMEAGRASERAPDAPAALVAYAQALSADPMSVGAALGRYRAHRAIGAPSAAVEALQRLEHATPDARLRSEFARKRARLLREVMGNAQAAVDALAEATSLPALREKLRAAETAGNSAQLLATLQAWARTATGVERGLAHLELATELARTGAKPAALAALHEAALAHAPQGLLALARAAVAQPRESLPPTAPPSRRPPAASADSASDAAEALRVAARLARDAQAVAEEREALSRVAPTEPEHVLSEILSFDAAAEMSDLSALQAGLLRELVRLPNARRPGPALALLSLTPGAHEQIGQQLAAALKGSPLVGRFIAARSSGAAAAALWLEESATASGERAAFAAVMAGHALRTAGADCVDAFAEALDHVRGYAPACFALELPARQKGDIAVLERVHRELATALDSPAERAGRRARLGLLSADNDLNHAIAWFELAAEHRPDDPLIADLLMRLAGEAGDHDYPKRLLEAARRESSGAFARAYELRAAAAYETMGMWTEAAGIYRSLLDRGAGDAFARAGLWQALRQSRSWDALAGELERQVQALDAGVGASGLLEDWAAVEARRGDLEREKTVLAHLLTVRPSSLVAMRGLARAAMADRDDAQLLALAESSLAALDHQAERSAVLRLCLRLRSLLGRADGDALLLAHEGRLQSELWFELALEAIAIERSDQSHYYEVTSKIASLLSEPVERAAYALRAAETLEATAPARALADLESYLLAAPRHPLALPALARLYRASASPESAAEALLRAAELAPVPERAAELFYAAGVMYDDDLGDSERAVAALSRVTDIDVCFADAFSRLRRLLYERQESAALLELLARRTSAPIDSGLAAELEIERAELLRATGDRPAALIALRVALTHDPARTDALRALADLLWDEGEYHKAAEALVQLARLTDDKIALSEVVFQLGSLYDEHLRDAKRAELAFTRASTLAPDDPRPIERLVQLWKRTGQNDRAVRALQHLIANSWSVSTKEGYILELATTLEQMGQRTLAEQALEDARQKAPTSMRVLRAQAALYEREDDRTALSLHLQRSCNALRGAIDDDPGDSNHWLQLIELLERRGRHDGAELVADAAYSCGLSLPNISRPKLEGLGAAALSEGVLRKIVTRGLLDPLRRLFREFHEELDEFLPVMVETTAALPESHTQAVRAVSELFALPALRLVGSEQSVCLPIAADPLTVCVGEDLFVSATEAERFFLLSRAVVVAKHGLILLVRAAPERVLLVLHALRSVVRPGHAVQVANEREQRSVTRELAKRLPPPRRTQLQPLLSDLLSAEDFSTRRLAAASFEFGARVALAISGNLPAALSGLQRLRGTPPDALPQEERLRLLHADPALRGLLSFAISEAYLDARREVLAPAAKHG
jgi:cellulose synthase operon protein C